MATFLLAWNPKYWAWEDFDSVVRQIKKGEPYFDSWSCGNSRKIKKGDRIFLIRLGREPKGIFARGVVVRGSYESEHWREEKAKAGKKIMRVDVQFDGMLDPERDKIIARSVLNKSPFAGISWDIQKSGMKIPESVARELEKLWINRVGFSLPEEIEEEEVFNEGAKSKVTVNAYERDPRARAKCISYYGYSCSACGFNFSEVYGEIGKEFIHVHHLKSLAEVGKQYQVNPIQDLRPICPNCHSIIHRRKPAYKIEELKEILERSKRT